MNSPSNIYVIKPAKNSYFFSYLCHRAPRWFLYVLSYHSIQIIRHHPEDDSQPANMDWMIISLNKLSCKSISLSYCLNIYAYPSLSSKILIIFLSWPARYPLWKNGWDTIIGESSVSLIRICKNPFAISFIFSISVAIFISPRIRSVVIFCLSFVNPSYIEHDIRSRSSI